MPNICLQMLLRGRNTVGYTPYPEQVTRAFVQEAAATGIDIFRIFDALNDVDQMRPAIDAVRETGTAVAEVALCYTGDLSDPAEDLYTLDYYLRLAEQIVDAGAHVLAIKDMAGLLRAPAARTLVTRAARAVRPARAPAHPRHRRRPARHLLAAWTAGADAVDGAVGGDGGHHQPAPAVGDRRRAPTTPSGPPGWTCARSTTWSRTGRPSAGSTRRSSRACRPRPGGSTPTRSPAGSCPTCASRPSRSASASGSRRSRTTTPPPTGCSAGWSRSPRPRRSSATWRCSWSAPGSTVEDFAADPGRYDMPDSVDRVPARRTRRPARRLAGAVPHQGTARARRRQAGAPLPAADETGLAGPRRSAAPR